jgi:hypothetical protein
MAKNIEIDDLAPGLRIHLRHHAWIEGRDAVANGYTGPNPYPIRGAGECNYWKQGYLDEVNRRLAAGLHALGPDA